MAELHLYEFEEGGFYAASSKEEAVRLYASDGGFAEDEAEDDFKREVPADEAIECTMEVGDKWDDPREYPKPIKPQPGYGGTKITEIWCLKLTAHEWANEHGHKSAGYCFGGDC